MIWITQWLCPSRHCSIGFAWDDSTYTAEKAEAAGEEVYSRGAVNRWCALCGSKDLKPEHGQTRFQTMEEAAPHLGALQLAQWVTRARLNQNRN